MNLSHSKIFATVCALGLAALNLSAQTASQFGELPLNFVAGPAAQFHAHARGSEFSVSPAGADFTLVKNDGGTASCRMQFVGANPAARITGEQPLTGTINYLIGNRPDRWQTGISTFGQVRVAEVYPGVNVVYYGNRQKLEYDFNLAAGVNPSVINLQFAGAEKISVNPQGELVIHFPSGEVVQHAPVAYQDINGSRQAVAAGYKILDTHTATFALDNYQHDQSLVIDPVLSFSTYFGGNRGEDGLAIAVNTNDGSIYVAGQTFSTSDTNNAFGTFATPGAFQTTNNGGHLTGDAFVARLDASGTNLIYVTYLGGANNNGIYGLAVDAAGNAFVAGFTDSPDFPTTNALYSQIGPKDPNTKTYPVSAIVAELNPAGSALVYSTYLGGSSMDAAYGIALDESGNAFVTGYTYSTNFPVTTNAFQPRLACPATTYINANAFVSEISTGGTNLNYSTFLGGTNFDVGRAIAYNNGRVFVAGHTMSTNFPLLHPLAGQDRLDGLTKKPQDKKKYDLNPDAFVTAFASTVTNLNILYSTYLGGSNYDVATGIAADANGSAYVCGSSSSFNFPNTATNVLYLSDGYSAHTNTALHTNKVDTAINTNGFLTRIDWDGNRRTNWIGYSARFGGHGASKGYDVANGVAVDPAGNAYVIGTTTSTNFPVTTNNLSAYLTAKNNRGKGKKNSSDVFIIAFTNNCSALLYSAYLGGEGGDFGNAIAVDTNGNAFITGMTRSTNFPAVNALQNHRTGSNDLFIAKISWTTNMASTLDTNTPPSGSPVPALLITPEDFSAASIQSKVAGSQISSPSGIRLKWKTSLTDSNYDVESSTDLTAGSWRTVPASLAYSNGCYHVILPATNGVQFYRLHHR